MWYRIIFTAMMCALVSCTSKYNLTIPSHQFDNVNLSISTQKDTIDDFITINVSFENNSRKDFYLSGRKHVGISGCDRESLWNLDIYFQDTIMYPPVIFSDLNLQKEDYFPLKSGEKYMFNFDVDFKKLYQENVRDITKRNKYYGEYSLKLSYEHSNRRNWLLKHRKAFEGRIESNVVTVMYKP